MLRYLMATAALLLAAASPAASQQQAAAAPGVVRPIKPPLYLRAQERLKELGEYKGPVTGRRDAATVDAIKRFQTTQKLPVSGRLTPETLKALGV
jgi:peptidoglycan hydrolase-like protein with peptidoglycan-binding domain